MRSHETIGPEGPRRSRARAWVRSDAPSLELTGTWRFRLSPVADPGDQPWLPDLDDEDWDLLPVPSHWVLHGRGRYGRPAYTNVRYPFPLDPPYVPDENPTGDHRRRFEVPRGWSGLGPDARTLLRLDGVESHAEVWLNGYAVGSSSGSRLVQELDVTDLLVEGDNFLLVRVHQWSAGSYVEDQDQWWLPGIFREVTLLARPAGSLDDVWLRADLDHSTGSGRLTPSIDAPAAAFPITLRLPELGVEVTWATAEDVAPVDVEAVDPWSADSPRLYDVEVVATGETVTFRTGFRTVEVVGNEVLVNGRPLRLRGVNRHEIDQREGRVFDRDRARADLLLMKRHHVDAIRTAHYPPHPELLELTDELGFWVMDECDLETHGFERSGWAGNPADDPRWREALMDRVERLVERDKNHPSVVFWSLGNESGTGQNLAHMAQAVRRRDPGRPLHYEGDATGAYTDIYSRMYPALEEIDAFFAGHGPVAAAHHPAGQVTAAEAARVRKMPFVLCEYLHAMGTGAGGAADYAERIERNPGLLGGFVWEWRDHALLDDDGNLSYGGDHGEEVHDGSFVCDGLVLADSTPTSGLLDWSATVAPVRTRRSGGDVVVSNDQHAARADVTVSWRVERDGEPIASGDLGTVSVPAGEQQALGLPVEIDSAAGREGAGEAWLTLETRAVDETPWREAGEVVHRSQERLARSVSSAPRPLPSAVPVVTGQEIALGEARFDASTGDLLAVAGHAVVGPVPELWRAPTDNDEGHGPFDYETIDPADSMTRARRGPSSADRWRATGLDRLRRRTVELTAGSPELVVRYRSAPSAEPVAVDTELRYRWRDGALHCDAFVVPVGPWTCSWPRAALRIHLPDLAGEIRWFGSGPGESYPDMRSGVHVGVFSAPVDEMTSRTVRPQESGHRSDLRHLELTTGAGGSLRLDVEPRGDTGRPGFTLSRWTSQQLAGSSHRHHLPEVEGAYLYLDLAQHGLGSRSCGPGVRPEHILWPRALSTSLVLRAD